MSLRKVAIAATTLLSLSFFVGCSGPEGTYKIDKESMMADMEGKSDEEKKFAEAMIDALDMTLEIKSGGEFEMKGKNLKGEEETSKGTWTADGANLTLKGEDGEMKCSLADKKLSCSEDGKDDKMVFVAS